MSGGKKYMNMNFILLEVEVDLGWFDFNSIKKVINQLPSKALSFGLQVVLAIVVLLIGLQIIKLIRKIFRKFMLRIDADKGVTQFLGSLLHVLLVIVLIYIIANAFGVASTSAVAILGSAGIAIGLALQGSLSNLAGGILILLLKPFEIGEYILEDSNGNSGTVTKIQIFYTTLTTIDGKIVVIPNGKLANNSITNYSDAKKRRIDIKVGISYDANIKQAKEILNNLINNECLILNEEEKIVFVSNLGDSSVDLNLRFWTEPKDYFTVLWKMNEEIKNVLDENKISIPYPQMDLHLKNEEKVIK
jgi:small conductance mechanosensitive channel